MGGGGILVFECSEARVRGSRLEVQGSRLAWRIKRGWDGSVGLAGSSLYIKTAWQCAGGSAERVALKKLPDSFAPPAASGSGYGHVCERCECTRAGSRKRGTRNEAPQVQNEENEEKTRKPTCDTRGSLRIRVANKKTKNIDIQSYTYIERGHFLL